MNVYLLTNLISGARALVFARVEHEARYRRPDGAVWRLGHWRQPGGHRMAPGLEWWPGSPDDIDIESVMRGIDADSDALHRSPVMAVKSMRRGPRRDSGVRRPSRPAPPAERLARSSVTVGAVPPGRTSSIFGRS